MRKSLARDWAGKAAGRVLRLGLGLLAGLALLTTTAASGTPPAATFSAAVNYTVGVNPHGVAVGDFNKDGHLDLAVANLNGNSVTVLFGKGDGTFDTTNAVTLSIGATSSGPIAIAVGDFNGDGNLDIVTANQGSGDVSVLLGNGNGTFQPAQSFAAGISLSALAVADFDGDGKLDLAVTDSANSAVLILLGNGVGNNVSFQTPLTFPTGFFPDAVVAADFNGDGKLDLAVANQDGTVSILLGNGAGAFTPTATLNVGLVPSALAAGDFNGDKNVDLLVADSSLNNVSVLLGDGKGGFTAASGSPISVGISPSAIVVGDFNGDGVLDFVTANVGNNDASLALGNGDGTFQPAVSLATHVNPVALAAGDFNGDKKLDLALANESSGDVSVLLNTTQNAPPPPPPPPSPISVTLSPNTAQTVVQGQTLSITATVANDAQNRGVNWLATCSPSPCGTFSPTSTPSGTPTTYAAPTPVSANLAVTVTATSVSDSTKAASLTVTVINLPPTANAGPNQTIECAKPSGAFATLSGSGADTDGDTLSFTWLDEHNMALSGVSVVNNVATVTVLVPLGAHTFTLAVNDGHGNIATASTQVTVQDTTPPSILSIVLTPSVLWPPDNKLVPITAQVRASDSCDPNPNVMLVSIWSTDRDDDKSDILKPDIVIQGASFWLRASKGDDWRDRVYTVTYLARDAAGNPSATASATVTVPHSQAFRGAGKKYGKRRKDNKNRD